MRKSGKKARHTGRDADFHAWRKKAKRLFYHLELTQAKPERRMVRAMKRAGKLQDTLGAYHDCVVIENQLRQMLPLSPDARRVAGLLEKRKGRLRKKACAVSRQIDILKSGPG
jgi:CHAD domain-containing protein